MAQIPYSAGMMTHKTSRQRGAPVVRKVLETALQQLAVHGYERLSVAEIAALAGLNKTSIYRRWPTKAALVGEALRACMGHAVEPPDSGDLRADLLVLARTALAFVESPLGLAVLRTLLAEGANPDVKTLAGVMLQQRGASGPGLLLERAIQRGDLAPDTDIPLVLTTVAGAIMHRLLIEQQVVSEQFLVRLIDLVLGGVKKA
jgi:AcrR family transcriptional regulator